MGRLIEVSLDAWFNLVRKAYDILKRAAEKGLRGEVKTKFRQCGDGYWRGELLLNEHALIIRVNKAYGPRGRGEYPVLELFIYVSPVENRLDPAKTFLKIGGEHVHELCMSNIKCVEEVLDELEKQV